MKHLLCSSALLLATSTDDRNTVVDAGKVPAPGSIAGSFGFGKLPCATIGADIIYASAFISGERFVAVANADPAKIR
ncbi:MAG: hypothetical protein QF412_08010 [Planctomycetota bacterium]|jgi:hypothetical protein|nr:hypothetical protein [Planctomycetota bacterium]